MPPGLGLSRLLQGCLLMSLAFGPFVLDEASGMLHRGREPVVLGRRGLALLQVLAGGNGVPVSKEELLAKVWSGRAVEDVNLTVQVAHLRKALGRTPEGSDWIVTVPRFGYRLAIDDVPSAGSVSLPMLAVLPFEYLSSDGGQQHLVNGLADELASALSRFRDFGIFSRHARPPFRSAAGATVYVLTGSVRIVAAVVRVVVMLADDTGRSLWSETFSGQIDDLLAFQDRVVRRVASTIQPHIHAAELSRSFRRPPASLDAYQLYLRGLARLYEFKAAANLEAASLLERAIAIEPDNGTYLGFCCWALEMRFGFGWPSTNADRKRCIELADRAVERSPEDASVLAHCALALQLVARQYQRGLEVAERAAAINPHDPVARLNAGLAHYIGGSLDDAYERLLYCATLQPHRAYEAMGILSNVCCAMGRHDEGLVWAHRALSINANYQSCHWVAVAVPAHLGQREEARQALANLLERHPGLTITGLSQVGPQETSREDFVLEGLRIAGLPE